MHAAAGGVGLIACQWAKHLGATVIGTVGNDEKAELARAHGCDHPVVYTRESFVDRVKELTGGRGVPVVYDSVGRDTFLDSLECLQPRGMMVSFGQSSGSVAPIDPGLLSAKGSLFLTRPTLMSYVPSRAELESCAGALFEVVAGGHVKVEVRQTFTSGGCGRSPPRAGRDAGPPVPRCSLPDATRGRSEFPMLSHCSDRPTRSMDCDHCE